MFRWSIALCALTVAALASGSSSLAARQRIQTKPNEPGQPTVGRMYIMNTGADDAIPVRLYGGTDVQPVTVMALPPVVLATGASVMSHPARAGWEYRQVSVAAGEDPSGALNAAGAEGWEAVGLVSGTRGTQVLLKRPR